MGAGGETSPSLLELLDFNLAGVIKRINLVRHAQAMKDMGAVTMEKVFMGPAEKVAEKLGLQGEELQAWNEAFLLD